MTDKRRGSRVQLIAAFPVAIGLTGIAIVTLVRAHLHGAASEAAQIAWGLIGGFAVAAGVLLLLALYSALQLASVRRLFPDDLVVSAVRAGQFDTSLRELGRVAGEDVAGPPHWFSIVLRADEMQFWGGVFRPNLALRIPSKEIRAIDVVDFGMNARGMVITMESSGERLSMPIVTLGAGPLWVFSQRREALEGTAEAWTKLLPLPDSGGPQV